MSDKPFLSGSFGRGFMLNFDWFQLYKHLTIMNLPRSSRFKNVLLIGVIPGPSEAKHNVNSYVNKLVIELNTLWSGVIMSALDSFGVEDKIIVRGVLLCIACDLPAGQKLCGFLGHNATFGCSKCYNFIYTSITFAFLKILWILHMEF